MHQCANWLMTILIVIILILIIMSTSNQSILDRFEKESFQENNQRVLTDLTARQISVGYANVDKDLYATTIESKDITTDTLNMTPLDPQLCFSFKASGNDVPEPPVCINSKNLVKLKNLDTQLQTMETNLNNRINQLNTKFTNLNTNVNSKLNQLSNNNAINQVNQRLNTLVQSTANNINGINKQIDTINKQTIPSLSTSLNSKMIDMSNLFSGFRRDIQTISQEYNRRCNNLEQIANQQGR